VSDVVKRALEASKDPAVFASLLARVREAAGKLGRKAVFMEVCGSHTWAISHTGIRDLLSDSVELISGPGCPVCVTSSGEVARMVELARQEGVLTATYGDMLRVPGPKGSLEQVRAEGHPVQVVYSATDTLDLAAEHPGSQVVFLGVGFETTAPSSAIALRLAKQRGLRNFTLYSAHKLMPPAMEAVLSSPDLKVDGLILPGHVSAVTGRKYFDFVGARFGMPSVIAGFEACDILLAVQRLIEKTLSGDPSVENRYPRAVSEEGNPKAMALLSEVFQEVSGAWRGLGEIPASVLAVSRRFADYDAVRRHALPSIKEEPDPPGCACAQVLAGRFKPKDCPLFGKGCDPSRPEGPCMVSSEGSCRAHYALGGWER
jgi:hydrogenase expression/formation protein HypD